MRMSDFRKGLAMMLVVWVLFGVTAYLFAADTFKRGLGAGEYYKNAGLTQGGTDYQARAMYCDDYDWKTVSFYQSLSADSTLILIDLSDTTTYPHTKTNSIIVRSIIMGTKGADYTHNWISYLGMLIRTGATNGDVDWLYKEDVAFSNTVTPAIELNIFDKAGINFKVDGGVSTFFSTGITTTDNTDWDNDDLKSTVLGGNTMVAVGDLVLFFDNIPGTDAVIKVNGIIVYRTE